MVHQQEKGENNTIMDITGSLTFLDRIRHVLNPLHIYCRLTYIGVSNKIALDICKTYEAFIYKQIIGKPC